jgi:hypothetical protein
MLHPAELCICGHTSEIHFGHNCSRVGCSCQQFAICDSAVGIFEALKASLPILEWANIHGSRCEEVLSQVKSAIQNALRENP